MRAFLRDLAVFAIYGGAFLVMNAHSLRPLRGAVWFMPVMALFIVPYVAWLRLTPSGREQDRRSQAQLRGAFGIYSRAMSRLSMVMMVPAFAVCWLTRSVNGFTFTWAGTVLAVYLYAVVMDRARKRTLA